MPTRKLRQCINWFGSTKAFVVMLVVFAINALWIAISGVYPMAFDEDFHLSLIRIYAHHLNPFLTTQTPDTYKLGAFTRDPSYLYHYLMSFPWRIVEHITSDFMTQVIIMRCLNIALFIGGIVIFRQVLRRSKLSARLINVAILLFILTPLTPLLAAQINYDNLFFVLLATSFLITIDLVHQLRQHHFSWSRASLLVIVCILSSLVKYAFLPIFFALGVYFIWQVIKWYRQDKKQLWQEMRNDFKRLTLPIKAGFIVTLIISSSLFIQRYGVNTVRYHTPIPECDQVLSISQCQAYGPWKRNYDIKNSPQPKVSYNPIRFSYIWIKQMAYNLAFTLNGPASGFAIGEPLLLPNIIIIGLCSVGLLVLVLGARRIFQDEVLRIGLLLVGIYLGALWLQNFSDYLHLGLPVAIQGRYLLPILIMSYVAILVAGAHLARHHQKIKFATIGLMIGGLMLGGGALTFIIRSDPSWYWQNQRIIDINGGLRNFLKPVIPGGKDLPKTY